MLAEKFSEVLKKTAMDDENFRRKWGLQRADFQASTSLVKVFLCQFFSTLLILYIIRPSFVLTKSSMHASETIHFGAMGVISGIVCVLTFYHPSFRMQSLR